MKNIHRAISMYDTEAPCPWPCLNGVAEPRRRSPCDRFVHELVCVLLVKLLFCHMDLL
jgi:hypothetical protein